MPPSIIHLQLTLRSQLLQNRLLQRLWLRSTSPPPLNLPIPPHQPLLKIPLNPLHAQQSWFLFFEPFKQGIGCIAVYVGFTHDGEGDAVVYEAEGLDVVVCAGLLGTELVAGEAEDLEIVSMCLLQLLIQFLQTLILWRESAFTSRVDDQDYFSFVGFEGCGVAFLVERLEVVE